MNLLQTRRQLLTASLLATATLAGWPASAQTPDRTRLEAVIDAAVKPLMKRADIPGMTVAITVKGQRFVFNYGLADKRSGRKVDDNTIFEVGSISKTYTATLAAYGQVQGTFALSDKAGRYLPALAGSSLDAVTMLDLATYTAGGLPLQFPDDVDDDAKMLAYYKAWRPAYAPGSHRLYSNPSIGLFGYLAARAMGKPFDGLMQGELLPKLGLASTFIKVPQDRMADYAFGYSKAGKPIRVNPGPMDQQAYGIKTTAADLIRFVEANIDPSKLEATLQRAITVTHSGYYQTGPMTQGLGWEIYAYPTTLERLLAGNSADMAFKPQAVHELTPPQSPQGSLLFNKTGSTNGFGSYVVYVPAKGIGIALLANRNYPIPDRVKIAWQILSVLDGGNDPAGKP
ncbi:class C beta-lactamase [Labrys neptuniae]